MLRWVFAAIGVLVLCVLLSACSRPGPPSLVERIDVLMAPLAADHRFSGAVAVNVDGRVVYARGFGLADVERKVPFTPETASDGGSLAKPVTAAAVLLLAADGRLDLDAPAGRWVAEYPHSATTLRQLLSHSGGLADYGAFQALLDSGRPIGNAELLREHARRGSAPAFVPGSAFDYCNLCYDALALTVERALDQRYEAFVQAQLLHPAGASSAFVRPARFADWEAVRTRGYRWAGGRATRNDAFDNEAFHGGGNIYWNVRDLAAWGAAWARGDGLPPAARRLALSPVRLEGRLSGLTLGNWYCAEGRTRCYYRGHHQGFDGVVYWDAERRLSIAFLSNSTLAPELQHALPRALIAGAEGGETEPLPTSPGLPFDIRLAAGGYRTPDGRRLRLDMADGRPRIEPEGGVSYRLFPASRNVLYAPGLDAYISQAADGLRWATVFESVPLHREAVGR